MTVNEFRLGKDSLWKPWTTYNPNCRNSIAIHPPAPTEPLGELIQHYTNTLCSAQKQSNLTTSLLQDIPIFNEHDTTHLEDWLVDMETAADLIAESRTKLAQA